MSDYTSYKVDYDRDGFRPSCATSCPPTNSQDLTAQVARYIREVVPTLPDQAAFYQDKDRPETPETATEAWATTTPSSPSTATNRAGRALSQTLIGEAAEVSQPEWFNKPPQTEHPTPPHQDNFYFNLTPPNVASIWLALDPVDEEKRLPALQPWLAPQRHPGRTAAPRCWVFRRALPITAPKTKPTKSRCICSPATR